jgi:hypothetical protein
MPITVQAQRIADELRRRGLRWRRTRAGSADFRVATDRVRERDPRTGVRYTVYGNAWAYATNKAARQLVADQAEGIAAAIDGWVALVYLEDQPDLSGPPSSAHVYSDHHPGGLVTRTVGNQREWFRDGTWRRYGRVDGG